MAQNVRIVGIDVSKAKIDCYVRSPRLRMSQPSTAEGRAGLVAWLRENAVDVAVMEASGGYEREWAETLRRAGIMVRIVDPKRVRHFAKSAGRLAKNDPIDAEMIAWFAETFSDQAGQPPEPEREELDRLMTARASLINVKTQLENQREHRQPNVVTTAHRAILRTLRRQLSKLQAAITAKIEANERFVEQTNIITSVPGLAELVAAGVIAWLPEAGRIDNKAVAALVGGAPYDDDSGQHQGQRHIRGGRRKLRNLLFMPVMGAATQHNPVLKAYYQRLIARGKKPKVALIACMRKLIVILNTMLARGETWDPSRHRVTA
jgi:transposase